MNNSPPSFLQVGWVGGHKGWKEQQCAGNGFQAQDLFLKKNKENK